MNSNDLTNLLYRRQYVISPEKITMEGNFKNIVISKNYYLYYHSDLSFTKVSKGNKALYLIGDLFDYRNTDFNNKQILKHLLQFSFDECLKETFNYCGRFFLIYIENDSIKLFHDAFASRKIYYHVNDKLWCASQPHLIAKFLNLKHSTNKEVLEYFKSVECKNNNYAGVMDATIYDTVKQLQPNKYLDFSLKIPVRYWPKKQYDKIKLNDAVKSCSGMIEGFLESVNKRHKLMLPVTAGIDSRILFAGTKKIRNNIFYYINKTSHLSEKSPDIYIPKKLVEKCNLKFNIVTSFEKTIEKDFLDIYHKNIEFASEEFIPVIYNYYRNFSDYINCPGIGNEITENVLDTSANVTAKTLAKFFHLSRFSFVQKKYNEWLMEIEPVVGKNKRMILDIFFWEEKGGNWGNQIQTCKDIAQEEILIYNSRKYLTTMLGLEKEYRNKSSHSILHKKIIENLWPELLSEPINPSFKSTLFLVLQKIKIYSLMKSLAGYVKYR